MKILTLQKNIDKINKKEKIMENFNIGENLETIKSLSNQITRTYRGVLKNERHFKEKAKSLGVPYSKNTFNTGIPNQVDRIQNTIKHIQKIIEDANSTENDGLETDMKKLIPMINGIKFSMISATTLEETVQLHENQSENEIKRNLYNKVQKTIQEAKIKKYRNCRDEESQKKVGLLGKLMGKEEIKNEKVNQMNLKIQLAEAAQPEEQENYSVKDMLVDLWVCAKTEFDGYLTPEMFKLYNAINQQYKPERSRNFFN